MAGGNALLFYTKLGNGKKNLLLFHGFGQDHSVFSTLAQSLSETYTCYLFDLYFHGKSSWPDHEHALEKSEWKDRVGAVIHENGLSSFSVLGYSLGAKFAMATLESFPDLTREIFLVAPDGIKTSFWYSLATYPVMFRKLFKSMIDHPVRFQALAKTLNGIGLLDNGIRRFAERQMDTKEKRDRVYHTWVVFRHFKFDLMELARIINQHKIPVSILVGRYDKVIRPESMERLTHLLDRHRLTLFDTGHNKLLGKELVEYLLKTPDDNQPQM